jgi:hypothetical protein
MPNNSRSAWYIDREAVRALLRDEMSIRGTNFTEVEEQTGVLSISLGQFVHPERRRDLATDNLITIIKWAGGDVNRFIKRRRSVVRHVDTYEQRELRRGTAFLKSQGVELAPGESAVEAMSRLLAQARENGFLA